MTTDRMRARAPQERPMTTISMRVPDEVIADLKRIAPRLGFSGYQRLIRSYIGQGLRRDADRAADGAGSSGEGAVDGRGLKLHVVLEKNAEGAVEAHAPAVPGCRATGATEAEALASLRRLVIAQLHARSEQGIPLTIRTAQIEIAVE